MRPLTFFFFLLVLHKDRSLQSINKKKKIEREEEKNNKQHFPQCLRGLLMGVLFNPKFSFYRHSSLSTRIQVVPIEIVSTAQRSKMPDSSSSKYMRYMKRLKKVINFLKKSIFYKVYFPFHLNKLSCDQCFFAK